MFVENPTDWYYGPEYIFQLNKSITVFLDFNLMENLTAMVKCRPKISSQNIQNTLLCRIYKITVSRNTIGIESLLKKNKRVSLAYKKAFKVSDQFIEIEFDRQGVQFFNMVSKKNNSNDYYDLTDIIDQVNIGIDLSTEVADSMKNDENTTSGSHTISGFTPYKVNAMRNTECNMSWTVTYTPSNQSDEDHELWLQKNDRKFGFQLVLLPVSYTNPVGKNFLIEKTRVTCIREPKYFWILDQTWKIHTVVNYLYIFWK